MKRLILALLGLLTLLALSCSSGSSSGGGSKPQANFIITSVVKTTTSYNSPSLTITVKNIGNATGYNVGCTSNARNAAGTIIDTALTFYAGLGDIAVNNSAQDEGVFFKLNSHNDYTSLTHSCTWLTR